MENPLLDEMKNVICYFEPVMTIAFVCCPEQLTNVCSRVLPDTDADYLKKRERFKNEAGECGQFKSSNRSSNLTFTEIDEYPWTVQIY